MMRRKDILFKLINKEKLAYKELEEFLISWNMKDE